MEESEEISVQRNQERERRRMRDRQRRQSMTVEQRERHLARRRRNYQIRRLRAETSNSNRLDIVVPMEPGLESGGEMVISNEHQGLNSATVTEGHEKINAECLQSVCQETLDNKSVDGAKTLRLSRIRCLARSLNHSGGGVGGNHENKSELMSKSCSEGTDDDGPGRLPGGVRLSRVKRLARGFNTAIDEGNGQGNREQDLLREETQVVSCAKLVFGQPTIAGGEDRSAL